MFELRRIQISSLNKRVSDVRGVLSGSGSGTAGAQRAAVIAMKGLQATAMGATGPIQEGKEGRMRTSTGRETGGAGKTGMVKQSTTATGM